jgi:hypothetical protein
LQRGNSVLALSVLQLQCGASSHWFALLRLWLAWQIGAQVWPVPSSKMGLAQHCCTLLSLVQHACVDSGPLPSTSSCTDSLRSLTPAGRELKKELSFSSSPTNSFPLPADVSCSGQPLLPPLISCSMNSFCCHSR